MPSPIPGPPPFASSTLSGLVSTTIQQFSGDKEFLGKIQATGNPVGLGTFTNGTLPSAASHPGAILYNTTVAKIQFSNGSIWASLDAGAGSFVQTTGDTMTGQLNIVGAGIAVDTADNTFVVDATSNRVGMGTASPGYPLEIVLPNPNNNSVHILNPENPGYSAIRFSDYLGTQQLTLGYGNPATTAPYDAKNFIHLGGTDLIFTTTGGAVRATFKGNGDFAFDTNTLYVDAANNRVGILTASPGFPLSVNGIISSSSGGFRFPDATTQATAFVPTSYVAKIGDTMSGQLTITGAGILVDSADNTFYVDATNNRVSIGHTAPTRVFDIRAPLADHLVQLQNTDVTGASSITFHDNPGTEKLRIGYANPSFGTAILQGLNFLHTNNVDLAIAHQAVLAHRFYAGSSNVAFDVADNLLFLDAANNRIGVLQGSPSASHLLDLNPTIGTNGHVIKIRNNSTSGYSDIEFFNNAGSAQGTIGYGNGSVTGGGAGDLSLHIPVGFTIRNGTTNLHNFTNTGGVTFDVADNVLVIEPINNRVMMGTTNTTGYGGFTHNQIMELGAGNKSLLIRGIGTIRKGLSIADTTNNRTWTWDHSTSGNNNRFELWYHNGTTEARILTTTTTGRLGINNVTPVVELDVDGAGQFTGSLTVDTDTLLVNAANSNVGIGGAANSAMKLHVFDGNMKIQGTGDAASIRLQRTENVDGSINPEFKIGTIVSGGVNLPMLKFTFTDQTFTDKDCFIIESSGTVASVSDGNRRSHYEAFIQTGDVDPVFRLNSSPYMTLELGPGGAKVSIGGLSRTSNVTTAVTDVPHGLQVGSTFHMSNSEADFPAFTVSTKTVASIISPTSFTYSDTGADATSTIVHFISGVTDVHFKRSDAFTAQLALGGGAKMTWYPDSMVAEPGYDIKTNVVSGIPLFWASAGYDRVAIGIAVPSSKLHVKGTATAEIVSIFQSPASHTNNITEWQTSGGTAIVTIGNTGNISTSFSKNAGNIVTVANPNTGATAYSAVNIQNSVGGWGLSTYSTGWTPQVTTDLANMAHIRSDSTLTNGILITTGGTRDLKFGTNDIVRALFDGSTGNFAVDTNTLYVDAVNNRVGINNGSPGQALDVTGNILASGTVTGSNLSGTNTGNVTLAAVGSTPNANAATLSGQALNLEPASASFPGVVTTGTQTLAGDKTLSGATTLSGTATFGSFIIYSQEVGITAFAGGGQGSATQLTKDHNFVDTVATNGDSVKLPTAVAGMKISVFNNGASQLAVFPATGAQIDSAGTNNSININSATGKEFYAYSSTQWYSR